MSIPWQGDVVGLVEEFRRGSRSPADELAAAIEAIERSRLNAFCYLDREGAMRLAGRVDLNLPLAGVPFGVKELERVDGWPLADGSELLAWRRARRTSTNVRRLVAAGAIPVGQTTSSEMALGPFTAAPLHGVTRNPWDLTATPGGSSGGSAAAVAGGLVPFATATDGGGSTRQPAALCGLPGLKVTWRLIPAGPEPVIEPLTVVVTALTRTIRDLCRILDVTAGFDARDPYSTPSVPRFEQGLGQRPTEGLRVAFLPNFGGAEMSSEVVDQAADALDELGKVCGLRRVPTIDLFIPERDARARALGLLRIRRFLAPQGRAARDRLSRDVRAAMDASDLVTIDDVAGADEARIEVIDAMADAFEQTDLLACPTAGEAFDAEGQFPTPAGAALWPANVSGVPALTVPIGTGPSGLPLGLQLIASHHQDGLLLELGHQWERHRPWPLVAPGAPT